MTSDRTPWTYKYCYGRIATFCILWHDRMTRQRSWRWHIWLKRELWQNNSIIRQHWEVQLWNGQITKWWHERNWKPVFLRRSCPLGEGLVALTPDRFRNGNRWNEHFFMMGFADTYIEYYIYSIWQIDIKTTSCVWSTFNLPSNFFCRWLWFGFVSEWASLMIAVCSEN